MVLLYLLSLFQLFSVKLFTSGVIYGVLTSTICSCLAKILLPGLKGGDRNRSPTYFGGGDKCSGMSGGFIPTDEAIKAKRDNERKFP